DVTTLPDWGSHPQHQRSAAGACTGQRARATNSAALSLPGAGASMYVARVAGQFIPKRMPGTGAQHDPGCESYEAPPELSGFGDVVGRAIQEDTDTGVTLVKLGFG